MDPASIFIILVVIVVGVGLGIFLFLTTAGLELREEGRRRHARRRPEHTRVENEQRVVSPSRPPRSGSSSSDAQTRS